MLLSVLRNGFTFEAIIQVLASVFVVFCLLPVHEFAHALIATKLGDETARLSGRLTLVPMAHIDIWGAVTLICFGFGWGKPVPVNMRNLKTKNKKLGMALVALAGPVSNLIMAFLFLFLAAIVNFTGMNVSFKEGLITFLYAASSINVTLAVFNFIPVPPLDGSRILTLFLPNKAYYTLMKYERYIAIGIMVLAFSGKLSIPLEYLSQRILHALYTVAMYPFTLIH